MSEAYRDRLYKEVNFSLPLLAIAEEYLPPNTVAAERDVSIKIRVSAGQYLEITYDPGDRETDPEIMFRATDCVLTDIPHSVNGYDDNNSYHGIQRACWVNAASGRILEYREATGELDDDIFMEDSIGPAIEPGGIPQPVTGVDPVVHELNKTVSAFTTDAHTAFLEYFRMPE